MNFIRLTGGLSLACLLAANEVAPPTGYTGADVDSSRTCRNCHTVPVIARNITFGIETAKDSFNLNEELWMRFYAFFPNMVATAGMSCIVESDSVPVGSWVLFDPATDTTGSYAHSLNSNGNPFGPSHVIYEGYAEWEVSWKSPPFSIASATVRCGCTIGNIDDTYEKDYTLEASYELTGPSGIGVGESSLRNRANLSYTGGRLHFTTTEPGRVKLSLYRSDGRLIGTLLEGERPVGEWSVTPPEEATGAWFAVLEHLGGRTVLKAVTPR